MSEETAPKPGDDKKARMMKAISTLPPALPSMFIPPKAEPSGIKQQATPQTQEPTKPSPPVGPDFRKLLRQGQKKDPIAGKKIREEEMVRCGYYLMAVEQRQFKLLAISNGHSMTELLRKAVQDYIRIHKHKLPKE
ncbi:hypothetical protein [Mesorhizobium huakuii]|uniref:Uncharacterized protein n=1 Tax=Mesorhizobium huakuii TaxID=28104 RepID=A0A7G6T4N8_9HYPH|nr:hypothetical protein [Mesorhizobium huakuii]QND61720.1 hypothetical protein HB778_36385 [Mesorhizobium huakuii]QND61830.1 hypothetical protein HB778_37185 [Mesorhizobium huakuii]